MSALFQYDVNVPSGALKDAHVAEIYKQSASESAFLPFVKILGPGENNGESVTIPRIRLLTEPGSSELDEGLSTPADELDMDTRKITLVERGRAVTWTRKAAKHLQFSLPSIAEEQLKTQMRLVKDTVIADSFKQSQVKYVPVTATTNDITTNGTPGSAAGSNLNFFHMREISDYMYQVLKAPKFDDGYYVAIITTKAARGIKDDLEFIEWHKYQGTVPYLFKGEVGMIEGIRVVVTNHDEALDNSIGTGGILGEGVVFGKDACAMALSENMSIRYEITDHQRFYSAGWFADFSCGLIWDTGNAGEAKSVHITST